MIIRLFLVTFIKLNLSSTICSAEKLIQELIEDVQYGGKLNCLLFPKTPNNQASDGESPKEANLRIKAAWTSECAFKARYNWPDIAKERYGIQNLVDVEGKPLDGPLDDQADICQLIRAFIAAGLFDGTTLKEIKEEIFEQISCPGPLTRKQYQVCAATVSPPAMPDEWLMFLEPLVLSSIEDGVAKPKFIPDTRTVQQLNLMKGMNNNAQSQTN